MNFRLISLPCLLLAGAMAFAQQPPNTAPGLPDSKAPAPKRDAAPAAKLGAAPSTDAGIAAERKQDKSAAYYHYMMAHIYEELVALYQRTEFADRAIEEYRLAIQNDPGSEYLNAGLAELYAKTGRIADAVKEAQEIIKRDPNNIEARRLLGRIYLRSLGDMQAGTQSQDILNRAVEQYEAIVKLQPQSVEDRLLLGRLYRLNNDTAKAEEQFKAAVNMQPGSEDAITTLAFLYNETGENRRAVELLTAVPEQQRSAKVWSGLGYSFEQLRDYKPAIAAYRKAVELDPDNLDAMRGLAQNLMSAGQNAEALKIYNTVVDADPNDVQTHMRMAEIWRRNGEFDRALEALGKAQQFVPDSQEVPYNKAVILQAQGKYQDAAALLVTVLSKSEKPDGEYSPSARNNRSIVLERLGTIYREQGKTQLAIDTFTKMLALGDENAARGYGEIIETYRTVKQYDKATQVAEQAVKRFPNERMLRMSYAQQLGDSHREEEAIQQLRSMMKNNKDDRDTHAALGQLYGRMKRYREAEESLNKALELSDTDFEKQYVTFVLGALYERQKKYAAAEELFRKVLAGDPDNAAALNYLGYMLADRGERLQEAVKMLRRAVQLEPQNGAYLDSLGWAYFKLGQYELAEQNLVRAAEREPNDPTIYDHLGDLYYKTGRLKLAVAKWERSVEEFGRSLPSEIDTADVAKVQKKLESAKVKLAKQNTKTKASK